MGKILKKQSVIKIIIYIIIIFIIYIIIIFIIPLGLNCIYKYSYFADKEYFRRFLANVCSVSSYFADNKYFQAYGLYLTIVCSLIGLPTIIVFYYKINTLEKNQEKTNLLANERGIKEKMKFLEDKNEISEEDKNEIKELKNKLKTVQEEISRWHS